MASFSTNKKYPLTLKPLTHPDVKTTHQDVFNLLNSFRILFGDLDTAFTDLRNLVGSGSGGEVLVSDTNSGPPVMLTNEDESDFLYSN